MCQTICSYHCSRLWTRAKWYLIDVSFKLRWENCSWKSQRTHDVIITSLLRQNDVTTSFWRNNDVIIMSCIRWEWARRHLFGKGCRGCYLHAPNEPRVARSLVGVERWGKSGCHILFHILSGEAGSCLIWNPTRRRSLAGSEFCLLWPDVKLYIHPCEKVIGIYFRHKFFIIYFLSFALVFIHDIYEVVNIKSVNFCWISIIGYTSVTFWKR